MTREPHPTVADVENGDQVRLIIDEKRTDNTYLGGSVETLNS